MQEVIIKFTNGDVRHYKFIRKELGYDGHTMKFFNKAHECLEVVLKNVLSMEIVN